MGRKKKSAAAASIAERAVELLRKEHKGSDANTLARGSRSTVKEVLPTGLAVLDEHVLGLGGLPYGRIVEIYGPESVGKSSLQWHLMKRAQDDGALVVFGQAEPALDPVWIDKFGVDRSQVVLPDCDTLERFLGEVETLLDKLKGQTKLAIFLDSVAALFPEAAHRGHIKGKEIPGAMGHAWSQWLGLKAQKIAKKNALLVLVNQVRSKIGVMFGPTSGPPGGQAIGFYSSIILKMWHGGYVKKGETKVGKWAGIRAEKNKCAPPLREAEILLDFDKGYDDAESTLVFARGAGAIDTKSDNLAEARKNLGWDGE